MKIDSLDKEKFTAGQGEIFPGQGKIKVGHDSRKRNASDKCPVLYKDVNIFSHF